MNLYCDYENISTPAFDKLVGDIQTYIYFYNKVTSLYGTIDFIPKEYEQTIDADKTNSAISF